MAKTEGILPIKLALTEGDYYTLWAPLWKEHGAEWQAFLGKGDHVFFFESPAQLLAYLKANPTHDLSSHPQWAAFQAGPADRVVPGPRDLYDVIGTPALLAERPSHDNVKGVARAFAVTQSLGNVASIAEVATFFASYSMLGNVERGSEHFAGENGFSEWSAIGRTVLKRWDGVVDKLDELVHTPSLNEAEVEVAQQDIDKAIADAKAEKERREQEAAAAAAAVDPYDESLWGTTGIDPIKIAIDGRVLYTLRTYVNNSPVFLGKFGEIRTFSNPKALLRWLVEHEDHDLARVATWPEVMDAVNGGTAEISVHRDNIYSFTGLTRDIAKGPKEVDTNQMRQAYELLADAADWADDDSLNSLLLANPGLQDYISYMLGAHSSYIPSAPYTDEAEGWKQLEESLTKRFSKV
ncbi:hypothetical protein [Corynebacterium epidermidicanis]|uniref:Uncharacterized protein n=1 Tax=Corynebacterium epidermidicanis TaxID=1050174 RepID=A0A0G3GSA7_9CORY|nr:hypothetical protein [Corynebacterium epidermidicanis]AKK02438.1 hypothetical protein CEPID_02790 [Corynebacterium epidermidicanis]